MRSSMRERTVLAGVDGTVDGETAALFAADLATAFNVPLELLHACHASPALCPLLPTESTPAVRVAVAAAAYNPYGSALHEQLMEAAGRRALEHAAALVKARHPRLTVEQRVVSSSPAKALVSASSRAAAIVLMRHRKHTSIGMLIGSTTDAVTAHADAPVVVIPPGYDADVPLEQVVLGFEGIPSEADAVHFAFEAADRLALGLLLVHAVREVDPAYEGIPQLVHEALAKSQADKRAIAESIAAWAEQFPDVVVATHYSNLPSVAAVLDECRPGRLVVIGSGSKGILLDPYIRTSAHTVISQAAGPIVIVRHNESRVHLTDHGSAPEPAKAGR